MRQSRNVYDEAWLLFFIGKIIGLFPINWRSWRLISYLYTAVILTVYNVLYGYLYSYASTMFEYLGEVSVAVKLRTFRYVLNTILLPVMLISTMYTREKLKRAYDEIEAVDKGLKFLNSSPNHREQNRRDVVFALSTILLVLIFHLSDYYGAKDDGKGFKYTLVWILDRFPDFVNNVIMCSFGLTMGKIGLRLKIANRIMEEMMMRQKNTVAIYDPIDRSHGFKWNLAWLIRAKLCRTVTIVVGAYEFQLTVLTVLHFLFACFHFNVVYTYMTSLDKTVDVLLSAIWGTFDGVRLAYVVHLYKILTIQHA